MRLTNDVTELPTRSTLRQTATRTRAVARDLATTAAVVVAAGTTFALGAAALAAALALVVTTLTGHPVALLAGAIVTTFALYTLPLLALRAAVRTARVARSVA